MQQKYRQGKERKKAGEEERGAGKRQGEIGKDDYTDRQAWKCSQGQRGGKERSGNEEENKKPRLFQPGHMDTGTNGD